MSLVESLMQRVTPRLDEAIPGRLVDVTEGVWQIERRVVFPLGLRMPLRTTLLALEDGSLLVHSPIAISDQMHEQITSLGDVRTIVAPNTFHHVFAPGWVERYPQAGFFTAPGLELRDIEIPPSSILGHEPPEQWRGSVDQHVIRGGEKFSEVVMFHRPSSTLLLTDLAFNGPPGETRWERWTWRAFGIPFGFGASRNIRWTLLRTVDDLESELRSVLEWPFERITVAHGPPVVDRAREQFRGAFGLSAALPAD